MSGSVQAFLLLWQCLDFLAASLDDGWERGKRTGQNIPKVRLIFSKNGGGREGIRVERS